MITMRSNQCEIATTFLPLIYFLKSQILYIYTILKEKCFVLKKKSLYFIAVLLLVKF